MTKYIFISILTIWALAPASVSAMCSEAVGKEAATANDWENPVALYPLKDVYANLEPGRTDANKALYLHIQEPRTAHRRTTRSGAVKYSVDSFRYRIVNDKFKLVREADISSYDPKTGEVLFSFGVDPKTGKEIIIEIPKNLKTGEYEPMPASVAARDFGLAELSGQYSTQLARKLHTALTNVKRKLPEFRQRFAVVLNHAQNQLKGMVRFFDARPNPREVPSDPPGELLLKELNADNDGYAHLLSDPNQIVYELGSYRIRGTPAEANVARELIDKLFYNVAETAENALFLAYAASAAHVRAYRHRFGMRVDKTFYFYADGTALVENASLTAEQKASLGTAKKAALERSGGEDPVMIARLYATSQDMMTALKPR
ncbi:MAG TPA: hypothetical protein VFV50_19225 [Bdellovibrionales bacterium]|nr:hypothetical protein [Bdellovibrionales bacterium]